MELGAVDAAKDFGALRSLYPRVLAKTLALTRSLPDAEDAVQEAVARALERWPHSGAPDSPEAWLVTVAANAHRDRLRRVHREELPGDAIESVAQMSPWIQAALGEPEIVRAWKDDLLRLLFACCHPALEEGESAALALATVIGLSTHEIARAFVVAPRSMEQRLTRARQRLRRLGEYESVEPDAAHERLGSVLRVVHLLFNEGYWSSDDAEDAPAIRADLCRLAIGLARSLVEAFPNESEVGGLLALLLLHNARSGARVGRDGEPIPLPEQDRSRWDHESIARASQLLAKALSAGRPGPLQIEAAISAVHCRASAAENTDWREIASLYAMLETFRQTPAIRVNRAFALARAEGPQAGFELLERKDVPNAASAPYSDLVRGTLLAELGRVDDARRSLERARDNARNEHERTQIGQRLNRLGTARQ